MSKVQIHLSDYSGRELGGEFKAQYISARKDRYTAHLKYGGTKANKSLGLAAVGLDREVIEELYLLSNARPWPARTNKS